MRRFMAVTLLVPFWIVGIAKAEQITASMEVLTHVTDGFKRKFNITFSDWKPPALLEFLPLPKKAETVLFEAQDPIRKSFGKYRYKFSIDTLVYESPGAASMAIQELRDRINADNQFLISISKCYELVVRVRDRLYWLSTPCSLSMDMFDIEKNFRAHILGAPENTIGAIRCRSGGWCSIDGGYAPSGFEWFQFEAGETDCLRPLGWFVKTEVRDDTASLFMSKQDMSKEGKFETGFTLNVVRKVHAKTGKSPSQYARIYLDELLAKHEGAADLELPTADGMPYIGAKYLDQEASPPAGVVTTLLADDASDILRVFILEAPQREWAEAWAGWRMPGCRISR